MIPVLATHKKCYSATASKGVEIQNSKSKRKTAPESTAVFLRPDYEAGRVTDTRPARGRSPLGLLRVLNLPATFAGCASKRPLQRWPGG